MSTVLGFLFNRYTFLILAIVIIVALVGAGRLVWNRYTIGGLLILALGIGGWTAIQKWEARIRADEHKIVVDEYNFKIEAQKATATALLATETAKVKTAEDALLKLHFEGELRDKTNEGAIVILADKLQRLGRLRDPGFTGCRPSGSSATSQTPASTNNSASDPSDGAGLLSEQASEFLREQAASSDKINIAYIACRADAYEVRQAK